MALMDAYGLSLVSVQAWGLLWGVLSTFFIVGGLVVARTGLGSNPVRILLLVNVVLWTVTVLFPVRSSIVLLAAGMAVFMLLMPFAEAAEQTMLQKVVPYERQGRVFGFAQSVEQAASPLTAFLIGPIAQFLVIPFMTDGCGRRHDRGWFGTGAERGLALVFVVTGVVGLLTTAARAAQPLLPPAVAVLRGPAGRRRRAAGRGRRPRRSVRRRPSVGVRVVLEHPEPRDRGVLGPVQVVDVAAQVEAVDPSAVVGPVEHPSRSARVAVLEGQDRREDLVEVDVRRVGHDLELHFFVLTHGCVTSTGSRASPATSVARPGRTSAGTRP